MSQRFLKPLWPSKMSKFKLWLYFSLFLFGWMPELLGRSINRFYAKLFFSWLRIGGSLGIPKISHLPGIWASLRPAIRAGLVDEGAWNGGRIFINQMGMRNMSDLVLNEANLRWSKPSIFSPWSRYQTSWWYTLILGLDIDQIED